MSGNNKWRIFLSILAVGVAIYFSLAKDPALGLDLKGGSQIVLDLKPRAGQQLNSDVANSTLNILRRRVDSLGVTEPTLELSGNDRINIDLPGLKDPEEAKRVIGSTAQLTFHPVLADLTQQLATTNTTAAPPSADGATTTLPATGQPASTVPTTAPASPSTTSAGLGASLPQQGTLGQAATDPTTTAPATTAAPTTTAAPATTATTAAPDPTANQNGALVIKDDQNNVLSLGPAQLDGNGVSTASAETDPTNGTWYININFKGDGSDAWAKLTGAAACNPSGDPKRQVAIVLDNKIISHPQVSPDGTNPVQCNVGIQGGQTTITGNFTQAQAKSLALLIRGGALPVDVSIASSQTIGPELGSAAITDSRNAVIVGGVLTLIYLMAYYRLLGVIATIALAAYTVISYAVFVILGLTLTLPGIAAFVLAVAMAMDSNVLVYERVKEEYASGRSLRSASRMGFKNALSAIIDSNATTFLAAFTLFFLAVGEVKGFGVSLVVGTAVSIFVTLVVLRVLVEGLLATDFFKRHPKSIGMHVAAGFRERMAQRPPDLMKLAKRLAALSVILLVLTVGGIVGKGITYGIEFTGGRLLQYSTTTAVSPDTARDRIAALGYSGAVVQRSGASDISVRLPNLTNDQAAQVDNVMKELGGGTATRLRDETIGPSFGAELKKKAMIGLAIGVAIQLAWVAVRFRWTFGIGAVLAMIHDALILLGIFVWLGKSFDSVFLASLLTIIAYSVNDTVVVFDRIREQRRRRAGEGFAHVVSDACAQTFPRTLNIGIAALCILVPLYFLGGQTLHDFALALIIGVVLGIYSSVFVASPIAVLLERWKPGVIARQAASTPRTAAARKAAAVKSPKPGQAGDDDVDDADDEAPVKSTTARPAPRPRSKRSSRRKK